ncbi:serine/threonine protein kinase [Candidatus Micrarchaeota archaeon CG_4_10_14_0_2_um_filter_60_11]|nr:MAG: serine/threonine protein kinase [Candidatus Micrarchaeota archaeon CG_4_10_14_0_2_um_filter_60_11]
MAHRQSKRKQPEREWKPLTERTKIAEHVFDDSTVEVLVSLLNTGAISSLDRPIAGGKEAVVFRASSRRGFKAVKVFKYENTSFHKMFDYVDGDPRFFKPSRQRRPLIKLWASKEFANLHAAYDAGVRVPEPYQLKDNVVLMQFLGVDGVQSALLVEVVLDDPKATHDAIVEDMRRTFQRAKLVHADLSAYNVILHEGKPYTIDWGQAVSVRHPHAMEFLRHDARTIASYFKRLGVNTSEEKILETVTNG